MTVPATSPVDAARIGASACTPVVSLEGLTKRFPVRRSVLKTLGRPSRGESVPVLQDVNIQVGEGEFFGLLGPNGAGKTTLFKILATLVTPDSGCARVAGYDVVSRAAEVRRLLTPVVADERSLYWRLSARQNLMLFAALYGLPSRDAGARVDELLRVVELADAGDKMVGAFSSGMRQRLLIARALIPRPRVLLLDEPTRSLDPISARSFRQFLRSEVSSRQGCTVLLATHNAEEALELCTRVAVLNRGRLLAVGATSELRREFGDERYRVWYRGDAARAIGTLAARGVVGAVHALTPEDGWDRIEVEIAGGLERAAHVVDALTCGGISVARFERVEPSLADLMERIMERRRAESDGA